MNLIVLSLLFTIAVTSASKDEHPNGKNHTEHHNGQNQIKPHNGGNHTEHQNDKNHTEPHDSRKHTEPHKDESDKVILEEESGEQILVTSLPLFNENFETPREPNGIRNILNTFERRMRLQRYLNETKQAAALVQLEVWEFCAYFIQFHTAKNEAQYFQVVVDQVYDKNTNRCRDSLYLPSFVCKLVIGKHDDYFGIVVLLLDTLVNNLKAVRNRFLDWEYINYIKKTKRRYRRKYIIQTTPNPKTKPTTEEKSI